MSDQRRYDEREVAEILERATATQPTRAPAPAANSSGLTLNELEEIGSEVGIPPARIAEAARAVASRDVAVAHRGFLGAPRTVSRVVPIPRPLDDYEWARLVADLRYTFGAQGRVAQHGQLRSWSNGNLQVHVEPNGDHWRVRMQTLKGDVVPLAGVSVAFLFVGLMLLAMAFGSGEVGSETLVIGGAFGLAGLGGLGYIRANLPGWAGERASQMEALAERIPELLKA